MTKVSKSRLSASEAKAHAKAAASKRPCSFKNIARMTKQEMEQAADQFCSDRTDFFPHVKFLGSRAFCDRLEFSEVCETRKELMKVLHAANRVEQDERDARVVEECVKNLSTFVDSMKCADKALLPGTKLFELKEQLCAALVSSDSSSEEQNRLAKELADEATRIQCQVARFVNRLNSDYYVLPK